MEEGKYGLEEAVKEWLAERGYDYQVRVCTPDGAGMDAAEKDTISIPAGVEDVEAFMAQFEKTFEGIKGITGLKNFQRGTESAFAEK